MTEMETKLLDALKGFVSQGCPVCSGDCASANPPVTFCPMTSAQALIAEAEALRHLPIAEVALESARHYSPVAEASDGWRPWPGGLNTPTGPFELVSVKYRNGVEDGDYAAHQFNWESDGDDYDIVAYRVVKEG